jgi:hypothetical protein
MITKVMRLAPFVAVAAMMLSTIAVKMSAFGVFDAIGLGIAFALGLIAREGL